MKIHAILTSWKNHSHLIDESFWNPCMQILRPIKQSIASSRFSAGTKAPWVVA